jgi:hypothetical protein
LSSKYLSSLAALVLVAATYALARLPPLDGSEAAALASRFRFERLALPEVPGHPPHKLVRAVHPSLERIAAWVSSLGAAATLADLDGDGLPNDIVHVDPRTDLVMVAPVPGTGERYVPFALGARTESAVAPMGTLAGDFDENGALDVLVYFWGRTPLLYLRDVEEGARGPVSAAEFATRELVESGERWYSNAAVQADLDGDGHLDLVIGGYFQEGARVLDPDADGTVVLHEGKARALNGGHEHFLLWRRPEEGPRPAAHYREVRDVLDEAVSRGWTLAMAAADVDGDLLPELYLANDFGPDRLLHNRSTAGQLRFAVLEGRRDLTTPKSCVLGHDSFKGMGVEFGDVNGDGLLDIYVSNVATRFGLTESHFLWLHTGDLERMKDGWAPYLHASEKLGLARSGFAWDARLADFDNAGTLEAVQACGVIQGVVNRWPELQALGTSNDRIVHAPAFWPSFRPGADLSGGDGNAFFVRASDGRYRNISSALGIDEPMVSRGIAIADVDGDGRLDFVAANQWGPSYLFRNEAPAAGAFLGLRLRHADGAPAIGATARVFLPDGRRLVAQVDGGGGHSGRRSPDLHFGLGDTDRAASFEVELAWRDRDGVVRRRELALAPGWHEVELR